MALVEDCPQCGTTRDPESRFCWFCSEDLAKHDTTCFECGEPRGLKEAVKRYVREELKE